MRRSQTRDPRKICKANAAYWLATVSAVRGPSMRNQEGRAVHMVAIPPGQVGRSEEKAIEGVIAKS